MKRKHLITVGSLTEGESALGAGGRAFKSPRPDQWKQQALYLRCR